MRLPDELEPETVLRWAATATARKFTRLACHPHTAWRSMAVASVAAHPWQLIFTMRVLVSAHEKLVLAHQSTCTSPRLCICLVATLPQPHPGCLQPPLQLLVRGFHLAPRPPLLRLLLHIHGRHQASHGHAAVQPADEQWCHERAGHQQRGWAAQNG